MKRTSQVDNTGIELAMSCAIHALRYTGRNAYYTSSAHGNAVPDVVIKQERRSRYAKYSILSILTAASQSTVSRIENKFREIGNVTDIHKSGRKNILDYEQKLDILLDIQDNPTLSCWFMTNKTSCRR
ncbi:hypothetical protein NQ318_018876 [Aromia moschata]|uniref:DUF4817 domain-containing protein n=1 Tax=Aromia moschata TaxID=1265417 RepID=A0AAV8ZIT2_9CUCU|nr:hypothetical protein NQ318_018876 [Aromia moschata]